MNTYIILHKSRCIACNSLHDAMTMARDIAGRWRRLTADDLTFFITYDGPITGPTLVNDSLIKKVESCHIGTGSNRPQFGAHGEGHRNWAYLAAELECPGLEQREDGWHLLPEIVTTYWRAHNVSPSK